LVVFETDAINPPTFETARSGKDLAAGEWIEVTITVHILPGDYCRLRQVAPTVTLIRWIEYSYT
jgi:hypothetical protein